MAFPKQRTVETMSVSEARQRFSHALNRVREDDVRIVVEKSGIPVAAVVPISVFEGDQENERRREEALAAFKSAQSGFIDVPEEEIEREIAQAIEEVKQEQRLARTIASALIRANPDLFTMGEESLASEVKRVLQAEEARRAQGFAGSSEKTS